MKIKIPDISKGPDFSEQQEKGQQEKEQQEKWARFMMDLKPPASGVVPASPKSVHFCQHAPGAPKKPRLTQSMSDNLRTKNVKKLVLPNKPKGVGSASANKEPSVNKELSANEDKGRIAKEVRRALFKSNSL